jgi:hypothetical protein
LWKTKSSCFGALRKGKIPFFLTLPHDQFSGNLGYFSLEKAPNFYPTCLKADHWIRITVGVLEIDQTFQDMVIIVGDRWILRRQAKNEILQRFQVPCAPIQIIEVSFSASLGNSNVLHHRNVDR